MPTLTVFLAPDGPAAGVLDVLTDLSAAGLVSEFLWVVDADIAVDEYGEGAPDAPAVRVVAGSSSETTVQSALADLPHDRRRLCVVVPVSDGAAVGSDAEQWLSTAVSFADYQVPTSLIRVVVARPGDHTSPGVLFRNGWHNIYLAPEDARGPGRPAQLLSRETDPVELGRHAAPAIAGLVGLWAGVDHTPLDDPRAPNGVRAGRAFYRRIDARAVEAELRSRVLSTRAPLPEPSGRTVNAVYVSDPAAACQTMAARWWQVHEPTLVGPRKAPETPPPIPTGLRSILRMFFSFVWAALRNAPFELFQGGVIAVKAGVARHVHHLVLGAGDSTYDVVVRGVDQRGMPLSWRRIGADIGRIDGRLAAGGEVGVDRRQPERPDLRKMWSDFADGAMTLVDGGKRALPPLSNDAHVWVLRSTAEAAPAPVDDFDKIPGQFHTLLETRRLQVGDVLGTEVLRRQLQHLLSDYTSAADAQRTLQDLGAWQERHRQTYSAQVGGLLAFRLLGMINEIGDHLRWLQEAANTMGPGVGGPSRARVWVTRLLALLAVLGVVAAPVLAVMKVVSVRAAIVIGVLPLAIWLIVVVTAYVRERREIFRDLNRRRALVSKVEAERANLRQATIDAGRLAEAYEQYLVWSRVVGAVLNRPFGPPGAAAPVGADITHGLPRTTRIARALVDEEATGFAAAALRTEIFQIGWLGVPWGEHVRGAGGQIGSYHLRNNPQALIDLRGGVADSDLRRWAELLADHDRGPSAGPGDTAWATVQELLRTTHRTRADNLFSAVREVGQDEQRTVDLEEFLSGVHLDKGSSRGQEFAAAHFTARGRTDRYGRVDVHEPVHAPLGLTRVDVLVQLTEAWEPWAFAVTEGPRRPAAPPVAPPSFPNGGGAPPVPEERQEEITGMPPPVAPEAPGGFH